MDDLCSSFGESKVWCGLENYEFFRSDLNEFGRFLVYSEQLSDEEKMRNRAKLYSRADIYLPPHVEDALRSALSSITTNDFVLNMFVFSHCVEMLL